MATFKLLVLGCGMPVITVVPITGIKPETEHMQDQVSAVAAREGRISNVSPFRFVLSTLGIL